VTDSYPVTLRADLRVMFVGGLTSYRALFAWLTPWILIPTFVLGPIFQVLFFANVGRAAGVGDDAFFVLGNAVQYAAIPCLFGMGNTVADERRTQTLGLLLISPAHRVPLFLGRALPVLVNGFAVSLLGLVVGALVLQVDLPVSSWPLLVLAVAVAAFSCSGLGLAMGAVSLRVREGAVLPNILYGVLLFLSGANTPLSALPGVLESIGRALPLTHGILAARTAAAGGGLGDVAGDLVTEALIGACYLVLGLVLLRLLERASRRSASLELA